MALIQLAPPYPVFTDKNGDPLDNGYLYFGVVDLNPETNPIQVYYDSAFTQPVAQPIRTSNGYPMRNGAPALIFAGSQFSVTVRDKNSDLVIYSPVGYGVDPGSIAGVVVVQDHTGDGVTTAFGMGASPSSENATNAYIDGVYQSKAGYSISGTTLTFSEAPPLYSAIEIVSNETSIIGGTDAGLVTYNEGGTGAVTRTVKAKLQETVSVKDFGAVGDGVTDDTAAIQAAIDSGARVITFGDGGSYYCGSQLNISSGSSVEMIKGPATLLIDHAGPDYPNSTKGISASKEITLRDVSMIAQNTDYTLTETDADGTDWVLNTREFCIGFLGVEGSTVENCYFKHFYTAIRINGSFDVAQRTSLTNNSTIQCGGGSSGVRPNMNFYQCNDLFIDNHYAYIGAEITLPSNKRVNFTNSTIVLPNKPAIDFGGSSASGSETDEINVSGNTVYGRDPIVCEFGGYRLNISDNICIVTMVQPNGVGIGVTSGSAGSQAIADITITGNQIRLISSDPYTDGSLATPIAQGIKVHQTATAAGFPSTLRRVKISNNSINTATFFGVYVDADFAASLYASEVEISNNYILEATYGVYVERINRLSISDNDIRFSTNAVLNKVCQDFVVKGNITASISGGTHYVIDNPQGTSNQIFIEHSNAASDAEAISTINMSVTAALPYMETNVMGSYSTTRIKTGSIARNVTPASGNYIGRVCTSGGVSTTVWANYGQIA